MGFSSNLGCAFLRSAAVGTECMIEMTDAHPVSTRPLCSIFDQKAALILNARDRGGAELPTLRASLSTVLPTSLSISAPPAVPTNMPVRPVRSTRDWSPFPAAMLRRKGRACAPVPCADSGIRCGSPTQMSSSGSDGRQQGNPRIRLGASIRAVVVGPRVELLGASVEVFITDEIASPQFRVRPTICAKRSRCRTWQGRCPTIQVRYCCPGLSNWRWISAAQSPRAFRRLSGLAARLSTIEYLRDARLRQTTAKCSASLAERSDASARGIDRRLRNIVQSRGRSVTSRMDPTP